MPCGWGGESALGSPTPSAGRFVVRENRLLMRNEGAVGDVVVDSALVKCLHQSGYIVDFADDL